MTVLTLKAGQDHLEKIVSTRDPIKGIAEFVWNSLDADATKVDVLFEQNALGGIENIIIKDNGLGITHERASTDFENVGSSWKRDNHLTQNNRAIHGKEGQGRLRFFSLTERANWKSTYFDGKNHQEISIFIAADKLQKADVSDPQLSSTDATGTNVELSNLKESFDWLLTEEARAAFSDIFAPYLLKYSGISITYAGQLVDPKTSINCDFEFPLQTVIVDGGAIKDIEVRVIEWKTISENRRLHFGGEQGVVLGSLPASVTAPGFSFTAYAYSPFFQEIADANLLEFDSLTDPKFSKVIDHLRDLLGGYFRRRMAERSGELIDELKAKGIYPYEGNPEDEVEEKEREVFDIATQAVSAYSSEFKKADDPQKKITLRLLREALKHNPDSVSQILHEVFRLPKKQQDEFANLLNKAHLGNIIAASSEIADRISVLEVIKTMVFNPKHRQSVKERGELDTLVQHNTWLFGENFHFTLSESGLTKVMERVAIDLKNKRTRKKVTKPDGKVGRVDTFMGRVVPHPEGEKREYLLIELKRPILKVKRKELDQLEDYVSAVTTQPDFQNTNTFWNFYLVTTDYDKKLTDRITQIDRPVGLYIDKPKYKVWVKTWGEIIRECEGRLKFIQDRLKVEVSEDEIESRIANLRKLVLKEDTSQ